MAEIDYIEQQKQSLDSFVRNLFTELEERLNYFEQPKTELEPMSTSNAAFAIIIMIAISVYFAAAILI